MSGGKQNKGPTGFKLATAAAIALAIAIFAIDAFTPLRYAIAVLYVLVVLLAAHVLDRRGVIVVSLFCVALTAVGFVFQHPLEEVGAVARALISVVAIVVAAALTIVNKRNTETLAGQAALLDLTHDAIFTRTPDDVILSWNRGAEVLYGWTKEEAVGKRSTELLGTESPAGWQAANETLAAEGRWDGQVRRQRRNGEPLVVLCRWALQRDRSGAPRTVLETHSDITERVEAELALDRSREELAHSERLSTLGELSASIVHEVNQPLAAISASGDASLRWLRRKEPDIGEATVLIERIVASAQRASDIVSRLRDFARRSASVHSNIAVNDLVDDIIPLLRREMRAQKVTVDVDRYPGNLTIEGDRVQLQQVLINLIVNAMQAMESNADRPREIGIAIVPGDGDNKGNAVIRVTDTGPGFTAEEGRKLFSPFFTTKAQGMGIGLSICRRIVEAHGGRIWAAPRTGGGAEFCISLPLSEGTTV